MLASFIIATLDRPADLALCLGSIAKMDGDDYEVIVVDQGDSAISGTPSPLPQAKHARLIKSGTRGLSTARNCALAEASGEYLIFVDDDATVAPDFLARLRDLAASGQAGDITCGLVVAPNSDKPIHRFQDQFAKEVCVNDINRCLACGMVIKREVFEKIGKFDPRFGAGAHWGSGEETDIVLRALTNRMRVIYQPQLRTYHRPFDARPPAELAKRFYNYGLGRGALMAKYWRETRKPKFLFMHAVSVLRPLCAAVLHLLVFKPAKFKAYIKSATGRMKGFGEFKPEGSSRDLMRRRTSRFPPVAAARHVRRWRFSSRPRSSAFGGFGVSILLALLAYVLIIIGLAINKGFYDAPSLVFVALGFSVFCVALVARYRATAGRIMPANLTGFLLSALVAMEGGIFLRHMRGMLRSIQLLPLRPLFVIAIALAIVLAVVFLLRKDTRSVAGRHFVWFCIIFLYAAAVIVRLAVLFGPVHSIIDEYDMLKDAVPVLLNGGNPYATTFFSLPNMLIDGFSYFPGSIFCVMPSVLLLGDPRGSSVLADLLAAALIYLLARKMLARAGKAGPSPHLFSLIFLFQPHTLFVINLAYPEPIAVMFLLAAALLFDNKKAGWLAPVALALSALVKQYLGLLFIPYFIARRKFTHAAIYAFVILVVCAPFFIAGPKAFLHATVTAHLDTFRGDSLSFATVIDRMYGFKLSSYFVAAGNVIFILIILLFARHKTGAQWFMAASTVLLFVNLLLMAKSFINYYYVATSLVVPLLAAFVYLGPVNGNAGNGPCERPPAC